MKKGICMEVSLLLMEQIAQLFIVLLMGYIVVKAKLLKPSDSKVLSVVFVYLIMPCVVLNAFQIDDTPEIRAGLLYSMAIAVGMHVVFLAFDTQAAEIGCSRESQHHLQQCGSIGYSVGTSFTWQ